MKIISIKNTIYFIVLCVIIYIYTTYYYYYKELFDNNRSSISKYISAIYYINLDKRNDRSSDFLDNFNEIDEARITRIPAHYYPENGAVGCLMSHITALNKGYSDNYGENILICEDDFMISDMEYCNRALNLLFDKIDNWDVIMLGQNTIYSNDTGFETENKEKIIKIKNSQTASGYIVKRDYIPRLLEIYESDMNTYLKTGIWDNYYTDQSWKVLQLKDNWYSFTPSVAVQRASYSDIANQYVDYGV